MPRKSDLPFGSEFSPSQIDLPTVLELAKQYEGDWKAFEDVIRKKYFEKGHEKTNEYNRGKLANNCKLGMFAYGIIDRETFSLTNFGETLYSLRNDPSALYTKLAKYILLNLHGMALVECVLDIQKSGERVTLTKLREWLEDRGIHFPSGGKHPSIMRLWLEMAGVFSKSPKWRVNEKRIQEILGIEVEDIYALSLLSPQQRAFLKALANSVVATKGENASDTSYKSNEIKKIAETVYGVKFNEKSLPQQVLYPLRDAGYIMLERGTKKKGRGAKPFLVTPTTKMQAEIIIPLLEQIEAQAQADLRPLLRKPLAEILEEINAEDKHRRGLALEALAFKLMRLIDMTYIGTRVRGSVTGGAEVDLIFESTRLVFSRWQVQCKNTNRVRLDDIAKEVGLIHFLKSNVIVIITTGSIGREARRFTNHTLQDTNLAIVFIEGEDIDRILESPEYIIEVFSRQAEHTMELRKLELGK